MIPLLLERASMPLEPIQRIARLTRRAEIGLDDKPVAAVDDAPTALPGRDDGVAVVEVVARLVLGRDGPLAEVVEIADKPRGRVVLRPEFDPGIAARRQRRDRIADVGPGAEPRLDDKLVQAVDGTEEAPDLHAGQAVAVETRSTLVLGRDRPHSEVVDIAVKARAAVLREGQVAASGKGHGAALRHRQHEIRQCGTRDEERRRRQCQQLDDGFHGSGF